MKLLLDQNLSRRLVGKLKRTYPGLQHVTTVGLENADDEAIWKSARDHGWIIVTKDSDFLHRSLVRGHPPKVIQLQVGNRTTDELMHLLVGSKATILHFTNKLDEALLILSE